MGFGKKFSVVDTVSLLPHPLGSGRSDTNPLFIHKIINI